MAMHSNQLELTNEMVRQLVCEQFPQWRDLDTRQVHAEGTVNAIFRIGEDFVARFRLLAKDPAMVNAALSAEAAAVCELAEHTRFPVPKHVALGEPGAGYPQSWSIQTWLPGVTASVVDPGASTVFAYDLASFISEVRSIDTQGRPFSGSNRGGDIKSHDGWVKECFEMSDSLLDLDPLRSLWQYFRELPDPPSLAMTHGDLTPGNVIVSEGRLAGVLDVGGLGPTDPALDLVAAWHLLETGPRAVLRSELDCSDLEWERGKAWAFEQAMGLVWYYQKTNPPMSSLGRRTLERLATGA